MNSFWGRPDRFLGALVIGLAVPTIAIGAGMTRADYSAAKDQAAAEYKSARARCEAMSGQDKDICVADAKAAEKKSRAEAEAKYKNNDKARRDARLQIADAQYDAAKAHCKVKKGNDRDVCMKEAKAAEVKAKADAKANAKIADAKADASADKREADYKVALERCDAISGSAKEACVSQAKAKYKH